MSTEPMAPEHKDCGHKPGKIVITRRADGGKRPWQVIIWGGDGDHPIDGAVFDSHAVALTAVHLTLAAWRVDVDLQRSMCAAAGLWCEDHGTCRPCSGCN